MLLTFTGEVEDAYLIVDFNGKPLPMRVLLGSRVLADIWKQGVQIEVS